MKVICAWCQNEGRPALVREKAPLWDARETHSICSHHLDKMNSRRPSSVPSADERMMSHPESLLHSYFHREPAICTE